MDINAFKAQVNKPLYTNCPECGGKMAIPLVTRLNDIVGTTPGCPSCGKLLFCVPPGKLILFDDKKHEASKELPVVCRECRGSGVVIHSQGDYKAQMTCGICHGESVDKDVLTKDCKTFEDLDLNLDAEDLACVERTQRAAYETLEKGALELGDELGKVTGWKDHLVTSTRFCFDWKDRLRILFGRSLHAESKTPLRRVLLPGDYGETIVDAYTESIFKRKPVLMSATSDDHQEEALGRSGSTKGVIMKKHTRNASALWFLVPWVVVLAGGSLLIAVFLKPSSHAAAIGVGGFLGLVGTGVGALIWMIMDLNRMKLGLDGCDKPIVLSNVDPCPRPTPTHQPKSSDSSD